MMRKVVVTGGCGFVGREVVRQLKVRNCYVRVMARNSCTLSGADDWVMADLESPESLGSVAEGMDTLIHLAGYAHATSRPYPEEVARHRRINLEGTCELVAAALKSGVRRVVYISSVKAGGEDSSECLTEETERVPSDPYGQLKREAEQRVLSMCAEAGIHAAVIRPALVYGAGVKGNIAAMVRAIDKGRFPPLPETHNVRSMVDVRDLAAAIILAAERDAANGRTYIITDGEAYSSRRIYSAIAQALGKNVPVWFVPATIFRLLGWIGDVLEAVSKRQAPFNSTLVSRLLGSACYCSVRAESELGFSPRYSFEQALPRIIAAEQD